ncbi:MAG: SlyX family protein [Spirochaetia bacterium]|nr:SlyX family protein [Spirochaetia bacterium]MDY4131288.1 SlyX family protein [Treponema sp.]
MDKELQDEIIKLETKLAYMEDFLNQLQEVTVEHTNLIEKLEKENKILSQKVSDMAEQLEGDIPNRKPPHY